MVIVGLMGLHSQQMASLNLFSPNSDSRPEKPLFGNIPNKHIPKKIGHSNKVGKSDVTMNEENVVVCERLGAN